MTLSPEDEHRRKSIKPEYTLGEAAEILRVPAPTLRDWMNKGQVRDYYITPGRHRWIKRSGLLKLAHDKGLTVVAGLERRTATRVRAAKIRVQVEYRRTPREKASGSGIGRLWNLSEGGFKLDRLHWEGHSLPSKTSDFRFEIHTGRLRGASGTARFTWLIDNRRERGITLGAKVRRFDSPEALKTWERYIESRMN